MKHTVNRQFVPSFASLIAFETAAQQDNFRSAAKKLNVTEGTVRCQVALLEERLGIKLFRRGRNSIALTDEGERYVKEVRFFFEQLSLATAKITFFHNAAGILRVSVPPTLCARWLIPLLPEFFRRHPNITIEFSSYTNPADFKQDNVDAAICFGNGKWPGVTQRRLIDDELVPVASPTVVARAKLQAPSDLKNVTLLLQSKRSDAWHLWFNQAGINLDNLPPVLLFESYAMVLRAAVAGLGAALVPRILASGELAGGELVTLTGHSIIEDKGYFLVYPPSKAAFPPVAIFGRWLLEVIERSGSNLETKPRRAAAAGSRAL